MNGNLRILSAMVIVIWINFLETIAFLRVEFSRISFEKSLEILKIFLLLKLTNDISGVGVFRKDFQNFKTFFEWNSGKFNSQKCNRFKKVYSYKMKLIILKFMAGGKTIYGFFEEEKKIAQKCFKNFF